LYCFKELVRSVSSKTILTPHPKELERLIGLENEVEKFENNYSFQKTILIVVMKGAPTHIIDGSTHLKNTTGNAASWQPQEAAMY
jgi:NAD(P)H-hydrate repair Nnr-like enzyme with NAD(P)H-hydrate dehydratase domain